MANQTDPALDALLLPFQRGDLVWPSGPSLFLRARLGPGLREFDTRQLRCEQSFKPDADALTQSGFAFVDEGEATEAASPCNAILLLPPRQRDEARALMARAMQSLGEGGTLIVSVPNNEGAKACEQDLRALAGMTGGITKYHCRVFWTRRGAQPLDEALLAKWRNLDAPRKILDGQFLSRPGVFAWDRIDPASALLVENLPADLRGRAADLGAGYGYLSRALLERCAGITALDVYEAEARALDMARINLRDARVDVRTFWHDVTGGVGERYDTIVMNPPFHAQGRADRPDIGQRFIAVAADALATGGRLWLVANRHLPYESVLDSRFGSVRTVAERGGFKIVEATKAKRA